MSNYFTEVTHISYQDNTFLMFNEQDPRENIGKSYERGMLPYGGGVGANGKISFVVSREEYLDKMERLKSLL